MAIRHIFTILTNSFMRFVKRNFIAKKRAQLGITQKSLAELLGVHRVTVAKWESMDGMLFQPHPEKWERIAEVLKCQPRHLYRL